MVFFKNAPKKIVNGESVERPTPRAPRIHSTLLEAMEVTFKTTKGDVSASVVNISSMGLCVMGLDIPSHEERLTARLKFRDTEFDVIMRVVHRTKDFVGFRFEKFPDAFQGFLRQYFRLQFLASTFIEVNPSFLNQPEEGQAHWFLDAQFNEIYFVVGKEGILYFQVVIDDQYLEGGSKLNLRTGRLKRGTNRYFSVKSSPVIKFDSTPSHDVLEKGTKLLRYVQYFCEWDFEELIRRLA